MTSICHIGAIVGGIIGGVAALAAMTAVVAFFVLRQRRRDRSGSPLSGKAMSGDEKVQADYKTNINHASNESSHHVLACDADAPAHQHLW